MRVLLVEDNEDDAFFIRETLSETTLEIKCAERLSTALEQLAKESFDAILLDLSLPDAHGLDTIGRVHSQAPGVPIVILTGLNDEEAAVKAVERGAQDYLIKGHTDGALLTRSLRYAMQRHRVEESLRERNRELLILKKISETILGSLDLRSVIERILEEAMQSGSFDLGNIRLLDRSGEMLEVVTSRGYRDPENALRHRALSRTTASAKSSFGDRLFKEPCIQEQVQQDSGNRTLKMEGVESFIMVPVRAGGEVLGIFQLASRTPRKFKPEEVNLLETIGNQMGVAVQKAQLYEETRDQAIELKKANKGKDEFLSVMSHELRTPLNVIAGYAEMTKRGIFGEINAEQQNALGTILGHSKDLLGMIDGILQATKIEAEAVKVAKEEVALGELLNEIKSTYAGSLDKDLNLRWDYPSELPSVATDGEKLKHILQNLINNAIKFTNQGSITIYVGYLTDSGKVAFKVADTGIGISEEELPFIFEKFHQVDSSATRTYGGVGLGLFIVKKFTERLGGELSVSSELGKGSTFTVTLPIEL
jgi:signal transduction histidine kinase